MIAGGGKHSSMRLNPKVPRPSKSLRMLSLATGSRLSRGQDLRLTAEWVGGATMGKNAGEVHVLPTATLGKARSKPTEYFEGEVLGRSSHGLVSNSDAELCISEASE